MVPLLRKEKKVYLTDPFIVRILERYVVGRKVVDESRMTELVTFNVLSSAGSVYFVKRDSETDFMMDREMIEVKWRERVEPRRGVLVLSKKEYDPESALYHCRRSSYGS
ncbi:MAG: hypothetical protein ACTSXJ_09330 [Candidatus Baldrarchaeia archaeon]